VKGLWWGVLEKGQCLLDNVHYYVDYKTISYSYTPIENTDTETEKEENVYIFVEQYKLPIFAIIFMLGTIGNVISLIITIPNKDMRTVPNMYILNLAISDIICLTAVFTNSWLHVDILCTSLQFCNRISVGLTTTFITVLSIRCTE